MVPVDFFPNQQCDSNAETGYDYPQRVSGGDSECHKRDADHEGDKPQGHARQKNPAKVDPDGFGHRPSRIRVDDWR